MAASLCSPISATTLTLIIDTMGKQRIYIVRDQSLMALVKIHNPRRHVELRIGRQDDKTGDNLILCGQDYIDAKTSSLIAGKKRTITKLRNRMPADDLFGLGKAECEANIAGIQAEIDALERGEFNYYVPATYINKIKQYIYI